MYYAGLVGFFGGSLRAMILSLGIAKLRFWPSVTIRVAMPITWPLLFITGLPLEPGEMGAVI